MGMSNVSTAVQMWNHVVMEQAMRSFPIGRKYNCEEEWWHMGASKLSQKQRDQWKSYVSTKLDKETWVEQVNEQGKIFVDKYLHTQCEFIRVVLKDAETSKEKRKQ
jgi:hypothetical protein